MLVICGCRMWVRPRRNVTQGPTRFLFHRSAFLHLGPALLSFRALSTMKPTSLSWDRMSPTQQEAWKVLGWNEQSWKGLKEAPASDTAFWKDLNPAQQMAAQYGLGYDSRSWDEELAGSTQNSSVSHGHQHLKTAESSDPTDLESKTESNFSAVEYSAPRSSGLLSSLFTATRAAASLVDVGFDVVKDPFAVVRNCNTTCS